MVRRVCPTCQGSACPTCDGEGFWDDAWSGIKNVASKAYDLVKEPLHEAVETFGGPAGKLVSNFARSQGYGKPPHHHSDGCAPVKAKRTRRGGISDHMHARNAVVQRVMKERGLKGPKALTEASSIVKREGLWKRQG